MNRKRTVYCSLCKGTFAYNEVKIFRIPQCEKRRQRWIDSCGIQFEKYARVCEYHFTDFDFKNGRRPSSGRTVLLPGAIPSLNLIDVPKPIKEEPNCSEFMYVNCSESLNIDIGCQTDGNPVEKNFRAENYTLKREIKMLKKNYAALHLKFEETNSLEASLNRLFTKGQIKNLKNIGKRPVWAWEDISKAICLHSASPRAYRHLYLNNFPLPHFRTLQKWSNKIDVKEGIISFAIECLKSNSFLYENERLCVLSFDEMKLREDYDTTEDLVNQPATFVQTVMVRGLKSTWKMPIYYDFDVKMTCSIMFDIIESLSEVHFTVVAIVGDLGPSNRSFWNEMNITYEKPWFDNPINPAYKIFVFADVPHLLNLIRNHFLDTGFKVANKIITPQTIAKLMKKTSTSNVSFSNKLIDKNISAQETERQKVKLATELFSNTTAQAIRQCITLKRDMYSPLETADFIQLVNDWFHVHSSKVKSNSYGMNLHVQDEIISKMTNIMKKPLIPGKKSLAPFQKGIIMSNNALQKLLNYVSENYGLQYILPCHLNQDIIKNFFNATRSKGGLHDHPSPKEFKYRIRKYMLAIWR